MGWMNKLVSVHLCLYTHIDRNTDLYTHLYFCEAVHGFTYTEI